MKQLILGTALGKFAMNARNITNLLWATFRRPEQVGSEANDQLAFHLMVKLCRSQMTFIDIGAHIGSVISSVIDHDPTILVIAIEASPEKAKKLLKKFPTVELHECAVSDADGEISFFINTKQTGCSSLGKPEKNSAENTTEITVPLKRLDMIVSSDNIDVIKIDVEGAELGVLRGGEKVILGNRPVIMFESGSPKDDGLGFSKEDMWSWFNERDFDVLIPNRIAHLGPGLSKEGFIEAHFYPRRTNNYFAVPVERRKEIRKRARDVLGISA